MLKCLNIETLIIMFTGTVITRLSEQDDMGWVKARDPHGNIGLIPGGYVEDIEWSPCNHGNRSSHWHGYMDV